MGSLERNLNRAPKPPTGEPEPFEGVYSVSAPMDREAGEPMVQLTLGKPSKVDANGVLLPNGFDKPWISYHFELPVMVSVGAQRIELIAKASISSELAGQKFGFTDLVQKDPTQPLDDVTAAAIKSAFDKTVGPRDQQQPIFESMLHEIELLCVAERERQHALREK